MVAILRFNVNFFLIFSRTDVSFEEKRANAAVQGLLGRPSAEAQTLTRQGTLQAGKFVEIAARPQSHLQQHC